MALILCFFFRKAPLIIIVPAALYQNATQITCVNTLRIYWIVQSLFSRPLICKPAIRKQASEVWSALKFSAYLTAWSVGNAFELHLNDKSSNADWVILEVKAYFADVA